MHPFTGHKRRHEMTEKAALTMASSQVNTGFARRDSREEGEGVPKSCDRCSVEDTQIIGAYRLCRDHAGPRWKDTA